MKYKFGFIGCGNMGGALVTSVVKVVNANDIAICDFDKNKVENYVNKYGVKYASSKEIASNCKFVVIGVKPQVMQETIKEISEELKNREDVVIISMAAGVEIKTILSYIGKDLPVIRIMPNTPVSVGEGMILYTCKNVLIEDENEFLASFNKAGKIDKLTEDKIDAGCALSGCGPAFAYMFIEALADAGVECGLSRDKAIMYASQTLFGSAKMVLQGNHPAVLKDAVCSPNGTTIAGVHALEKGCFRGTTMNAVLSAYEKTLSLKNKK